jgi:hypothetical protein
VRLILPTSDGAVPLAVVATGQRTILELDIPPLAEGASALLDVLDVRPDGSTWLMGTRTERGPCGPRTTRVELRPFAVPGSHLLLVEWNGARRPGSVAVAVVAAPAKKPAVRTRRYLGRGQQY